MAWHGMAWYGMVWYGMVWYGMVWYGMYVGMFIHPYMDVSGICPCMYCLHSGLLVCVCLHVSVHVGLSGSSDTLH